MAEIQGAVIAADVNDDGKIELVSADTHGNVAVWTPKGDLIWEKHLKSLIPQVCYLNLSMSMCAAWLLSFRLMVWLFDGISK